MTHTHHTAESLHALTDAAFNRVVAELAGWAVDALRMHRDTATKLYVRRDRFGDLYGPRDGSDFYLNENEAWDDIPDYANDLNAAWSLCDPGRCEWYVHTVADVSTAIIAPVGSNQDANLYAYAEEVEHSQPARALSTAWVLWRQAHTTDERED